MKTLSDDITIKLPTTGMSAGYVITNIYANGVGVFSGHSYIPGDNSSLYININDIASQNRGQDDFLKLNDDGEVEDVQVAPVPRPHRFVRGQIGTYKANITNNSSAYQDEVDVLCGYDYENKNIKPNFIDNDTDTSLCRIMQGCHWIYNHDEEIGNFENMLLHHLPYISTKKYGMGLQLWQPTIGIESEYSLRLTTGADIRLGFPVYMSNQTFVSLYSLFNLVNTSYGPEYNSKVYLKMYGTSGDEFGDFIEGLILYKGFVNLSAIQVSGFKNGVETDLGTFDEGVTFGVYLRRYIMQTGAQWNYDNIMAGNRTVYATDWGRNITVQQEVNQYEAGFVSTEIPRSAPAELQYDYLMATPIFSDYREQNQFPDEFVGTCPVAILDGCYSRYYLAWCDRYGDIQSQAFDGRIEYTEEINTEEIIDYKNRRRPSVKNVQPQWKLNTKWLSDAIYPIYESIFTSPYLLLYDTEQDKSWNVIITDSDYTEKKYKNDKLFNLEINVEACKKQNLIY